MRFAKLWSRCGVAFVLLVVYLSLAPHAPDVGRMHDVKVGHFLAYGWLMFWFCQIHRSLGRRVSIALALVLMGVALEYAQRMTGYRSFAYGDMVDNALGVAAGLALGLTPLNRMLLAVEAIYLRRAAASSSS